MNLNSKTFAKIIAVLSICFTMARQPSFGKDIAPTKPAETTNTVSYVKTGSIQMEVQDIAQVMDDEAKRIAARSIVSIKLEFQKRQTVRLNAKKTSGNSAFPNGLRWPGGGRISSKFGMRGGRPHEGIDIPMPKGAPIHAAYDGVVADTTYTNDGRYNGYGNMVILNHGKGMSTRYAHCDRLAVKRGQRVKKGDVVGYAGRTGHATGNVLHFEIRQGNRALDPLKYLGRAR